MGIFAGKTKKSGGMEVNLGLNTKMDVLLSATLFLRRNVPKLISSLHHPLVNSIEIGSSKFQRRFEFDKFWLIFNVY